LLVKLKLTGAEKYQADLRRVEERTTRSSSRITDFLKKWKLAFVGVVAGAAGAFYALARVSPSLDTQMSRLRIAFEYLAMVIGEKLAPYLDPLVDLLEKVIYKVADWIDAMSPEEFDRWLGLIMQSGLGLITVVYGVGKLVRKLLNLREEIKESGGVIPWLAGKWDWFVTKLHEIWDWVHPYLVRIWDKIKEKAKEKWDDIKERIYEKWEDIKEKAWTKWEEIKKILPEKIENAGKAVLDYVKDKLKKKLEEWWDKIKEKAETAWDKIKDAIWTPIKEAYDKVSYYVGLILDKLENVPGIGGLISAGRERFGGAGAGSTTNTTNQQISVNVEGGKEWTDEDWVQRISERILDELARRSGT